MDFSTSRLTAQQQMDLLTSPPGQPLMADIFAVLTSDYTLTSQTTTQKLFNFGANAGGLLTLPTGLYTFEVGLDITGMSATSGNATFDLVATGSATLASIWQQAIGVDATTQGTQAAAGAAVSLTSQIALAVAATGTALGARVSGDFNVSGAGTILPSILLDTAAAAVVKAGSFFRARRVGDYGNNYSALWY